MFSVPRRVRSDYQLEGVCQDLDGRDLLAALATGSGKTGFYYMYMLMLIELSKNPSLCDPLYPAALKDPAMVAVYPPIGLEEQATVFSCFGLHSLVINANTLDTARASGEILWAQACAGVMGSSFRTESYRQIGFVRTRMLSHVRVITTSATVRTGNPKATIAGPLASLRASSMSSVDQMSGGTCTAWEMEHMAGQDLAGCFASKLPGTPGVLRSIMSVCVWAVMDLEDELEGSMFRAT
ncbi:hypothetical protein C8Q72DRAFT_944441 [Fomitopsis betulina]|nr:hypothetical protein C8Q72DRAFT_944440 [Fomitopsis betulina]KAI0728801.1 hypothetical protein C8Q72DRAFT_944441 [Fomitopsis betulina]